MHLKYKIGKGAIGIRDSAQITSRSVVNKAGCVCEIRPWQEDCLRIGSSLPNGCHGSLDGICPQWQAGKIVRLVHYPKNNLGFVAILIVTARSAGRVFSHYLRGWLCYHSCNLRPQVCKLRIRWPALTNDLAFKSSIVVDVDNARRGHGKARLDELVVFCEICWIQSSV